MKSPIPKFLLLLTLATSIAAFGQIRSGVISGLTRDSSGAAIPEVGVTIAETQTNQVYKTATNSDGGFTVPYLPPGVYSVTVA